MGGRRKIVQTNLQSALSKPLPKTVYLGDKDEFTKLMIDNSEKGVFPTKAYSPSARANESWSMLAKNHKTRIDYWGKEPSIEPLAITVSKHVMSKKGYMGKLRV